MKITIDTKDLKSQWHLLEGLRDGRELQVHLKGAWFKYNEGADVDFVIETKHERRLKPIPKLVPFTQANAPIGAEIRIKCQYEACYIIGKVLHDGIFIISPGNSLIFIRFTTLVGDYEYRYLGPKPTEWMPCGTIEGGE